MRSFHSALNATVSGVTVVTTRVGGRPLGQTVTTLTSLSDESPLLLVAVSGEFAAAVTERGAFAVNVLGDDQAALAETFRGESPEFSDRHWWPVGGGALPRLHGAAAWFECRVERVVAGRRARARGSARSRARRVARRARWRTCAAATPRRWPLEGCRDRRRG